MEVSRALDQIAEIHQQIAKGELYRGYRSLPLAASGLMGIAAAWFQPVTLGAADPIGYVLYWIAIAVGAGFVGSSEILYNYVVHQDGSGRRPRVLICRGRAAGLPSSITLPDSRCCGSRAARSR